MRSTVCIVGGGVAGLSCALELGVMSIDCTLVEKNDFFGGNSRMEIGGISGISEMTYESDSEELFFSDVIQSGMGESNQELVRTMIQRSEDSVRFLEDRGVEIEKLLNLCGHTYARVHSNSRNGLGFGEHVLLSLEHALSMEEDNIQVITNSEVIDLEKTEDGEFVVTITQDSGGLNTITCEFLVLASGGFTSDIISFPPVSEKDVLDSLSTTNREGTTGEIINLSNRNLGANIVNSHHLQMTPGILNPSSPNESQVKQISCDKIFSSGGILVNEEGVRFIDETSNTINQIASSLIQKGDIYPGTNRWYSRVVMDEETIEMSMGKNDFEKYYVSESLVNLYVNSLEFCDQEELDYETFISNSPFDEEEMLFVMYVTPAIQETLGGIEIDECSRVVSVKSETDSDNDKNIIYGLYASGECTGGIHGLNQLSGNGFLDCVSFARTAAHDIIFEKIVNIMEEVEQSKKDEKKKKWETVK